MYKNNTCVQRSKQGNCRNLGNFEIDVFESSVTLKILLTSKVSITSIFRNFLNLLHFQKYFSASLIVSGHFVNILPRKSVGISFVCDNKLKLTIFSLFL